MKETLGGENAMKLLITAGHNWWVVMPNFVVQEESLEEVPERPRVRGPIAPEHARVVKMKGRLSG